MIYKTLAVLALVALVAVPGYAQQADLKPAPTVAPEVAGVVITVEATTVYALPRSDARNGSRYVVLSILTDAGAMARVVVPWEALARGMRSAPNPGDEFAATPTLEVLHGFATPQHVARSFAVIPH